MRMLTTGEAKDLCSGRYINTIKSVRERTGMGLGESKQFVDECLEEMGYMAHTDCGACGGRGYVRQKSDEYLAIMDARMKVLRTIEG